ncbi:jg13597 [Pararge aegeria aegeria]|uniref:Jg13597 protein n=1 Tax=Pararge aegeria aegeria TaxID=348720 RepID=A0A8S4QV09_9NEOP|nr:jg13597 [Pararge aegeria aegeria]
MNAIFPQHGSRAVLATSPHQLGEVTVARGAAGAPSAPSLAVTLAFIRSGHTTTLRHSTIGLALGLKVRSPA